MGNTGLWLINTIFNSLKNRRISKNNKLARGVEEYKSITVSDLFPPNSCKDSVIISGGSQNERLHISRELLRNAYNENHPVIVLHTANNDLENVILQNGLGTVVNERNKKFDAFTSFELNEIIQVVTDTCKSKYDIKPAARYVLQVVYDLLLNKGKKPYFSSFANCPFFKLSDQITTRLNNGSLSQDVADKLNSYLLTGQTECSKIDTFFCDMRSQINYLSASDPAGAKAVSVLTAIKKNQILCIDIRSSGNSMLIELIVNSLTIAMNRGCNFSLFIDDVSFVNNDMLKNLLCQKSNHKNIIVSKDLYALTGGKEDVFSTLISEAEKTVIFSHSSNVSCDKWSKYLGEYEKIDVSYNNNSGWNHNEKSGYNTNSGQTETLKREFKVKPEQINRLSQNEAFIYDNTTGSLIKTVIL